MYFDENNNFFQTSNYDYNSIDNDISYNDYDINIDSINFNRNNKLFTIEEGYNKGNMFENLYSKYKNYVYKLSTSNEKDNLLYNIQMYNFALKDLNLYLDINPNDQYMLMEYQKIRKKLEELKEKYEYKYGPLCAEKSLNEDKFSWIKNPWPWDKGGN